MLSAVGPCVVRPPWQRVAPLAHSHETVKRVSVNSLGCRRIDIAKRSCLHAAATHLASGRVAGGLLTPYLGTFSTVGARHTTMTSFSHYQAFLLVGSTLMESSGNDEDKRPSAAADPSTRQSKKLFPTLGLGVLDSHRGAGFGNPWDLLGASHEGATERVRNKNPRDKHPGLVFFFGRARDRGRGNETMWSSSILFCYDLFFLFACWGCLVKCSLRGFRDLYFSDCLCHPKRQGERGAKKKKTFRILGRNLRGSFVPDMHRHNQGSQLAFAFAGWFSISWLF